MSLLEDARRLAAHELRDCDDLGYGFCPLCERAEGHNPDCPWLSLPRIVAALGAARVAVEAARDTYPKRYLPPGHPLSDLALALYGAPTAIVRQVVSSDTC